MNRKFRHSLGSKAALLIIIITFIVSSASILAGAHIIHHYIKNRYKQSATELASTISVSIDAEAVLRLRQKVMDTYNKTETKVGSEEWGTPEFDEYASHFSSIKEDPDYKNLMSSLRKIQSVNEVDCVYLSWVTSNPDSFIYIIDAAIEEPCPIGCIDPLYDINKAVISNPDIGFPAYTTKTEAYGHLVTAGVPIYTRNDEIAAYALVDISMDEIDRVQRHQVMMIFLMDGLISLVICLICIHYIHTTVTTPINKLNDAALKYLSGEQNNSLTSSRFLALYIHTGDEIEQLWTSMKQMERNMNDNITNIIAITNELSEKKIEVSQISKMARTDSLTGVQNKLAYDEAIKKLTEDSNNGGTRFGLAVFDLNNLKSVNDNYGHDKGNAYIISNVLTICEEFKHSPVFRIGGDEFVVILKNEDYQNIDHHLSNIDTLNKKCFSDSSMKDWEKISIAFGYALFNKVQDNSVDSVFHRADMAMYKKKKQMKTTAGIRE